MVSHTRVIRFVVTKVRKVISGAVHPDCQAEILLGEKA